jgi:hypothetical protein
LETLAMFRFTIRDVLWLTVVVGLGFGWLLSEVSRQRALENSQRWKDRATMLETTYEKNLQRMNARLANEADRRVAAEKANKSN